MKRLIAAIVIAALPVLALLALRSEAFDRYLAGQLPDWLASRGVSLSFQTLEFEPYPLALTLSGVRVETRDRTWTLTADRLEVGLYLLKSLLGIPHLSLEADHPSVSGTLSRKKGEGTAGGSPPPVVFETVRVVGGSLDVEVPGEGGSLEVPDLEVDWVQNRGSARVGESRVRWRGQSLSVETIEFRGERRFAALRIDELSLRGPGLRLGLNGKVGPWDLLNLSVEFEGDLAVIPPAWLSATKAEQFEDLTGKLTCAGKVRGRIDKPSFKGEVALSEGHWRTLEVKALNAGLSWKGRELQFRDVSADTSVGALSGTSGSLLWQKGLMMEARGEVTGYELRRFMEFLRPKAFPVGVLVDGTFEVRGPIKPELDLECEVDLRARNLDVTTTGTGTPQTRFELPAARATGKLNVGAHEIHFGAMKVEADSVSVAVTGGRIEYRHGLWFDTDAQIRNLSLVRRYIPEGFDARGRAQGRFGGPYRELKFEYDFDLSSVLVLGQEVGRLRGSAAYDLRELEVREGRLTGPLGQFEGGGSVGLRRDGTWDFEVRGEEVDPVGVLDLIEPWRHIELPVSGGKADFAGNLAGPLSAPSFTGSARARALSLRGISIDEVRARGSVSPSLWKLDDGGLEGLGGHLSASGEGRLGRGAAGTFRLKGTLGRVDLESVVGALGWEGGVQGLASGSFEASGSYGDPRARFTGDVSRAAVLGSPLGTVGVELRYGDGKGEGRLVAHGDALTMRGTLELEGDLPYSGELILADLPWDLLPRSIVELPVTGESLSGSATVTGAVRRAALPALTADFEAAGVRSGQVEVGTVHLEGHYDREGGSFAVTAWGDELRVKGLYAPQEDARLDLTVTLDGFEVDRLGEIPIIQAGALSADGRARVSAERWMGLQGLEKLKAVDDLTVDGRLRGSHLREGAPLPEMTFRIRSSGGLPRFELNSEGLRAEGKLVDLGSLAWEASAQLENWDSTAFAAQNWNLQKVSGRWTGKASVNGQGSSVRDGQFEGSVSGLAWGPLAPADWDLGASWDRGRGVVHGRATGGGDVRVELQSSGGLKLQAEFREIPLRGWWTGTSAPADIEGSLSGSTSWAEDAGGHLTGQVSLTDLEVTYASFELRNRGNLELRYGDGVLKVESFRLADHVIDLTAKGQVALGGDWDLGVEGVLDLGLLPRFTPELRAASGTAKVDLEVSGPLSAPRVQGPIEIAAGATIDLVRLQHRFEDLDALFYLDGPRGLSIEWIDAQFGRGRIHVEGNVDLTDWKPGKLRLLAEIRDVNYEWPPQVRYAFDSDLLVTGTVQSPEIRGEVSLEQFDYGRRLNWKTMVLNLLRRRPREVQTASRGGVFVDLSIRGADNLRVENNLAELSLQLDVRARGTLPSPVLWGRVEALDGTVQFRSQEYEIVRSAVEFLGETRPVPILDIHARTVVQDYQVSVEITGPLDDYEVQLTSVPPLPQTDVVALLTLGTTADDLAGGESVTAAEAASFLTGSFQDELEDEVGDILGLDQFHIDPTYSPAAQTTVPQVTVGKAVTRELYARYSAAIGGQAEQTAELQYTLTPRISLLGTWSETGSETRGSVGGEVRFRFTFR